MPASTPATPSSFYRIYDKATNKTVFATSAKPEAFQMFKLSKYTEMNLEYEECPVVAIESHIKCWANTYAERKK